MLFRNKLVSVILVCALAGCTYANTFSNANSQSVAISPQSLALASDNGDPPNAKTFLSQPAKNVVLARKLWLNSTREE